MNKAVKELMEQLVSERDTLRSQTVMLWNVVQAQYEEMNELKESNEQMLTDNAELKNQIIELERVKNPAVQLFSLQKDTSSTGDADEQSVFDLPESESVSEIGVNRTRDQERKLSLDDNKDTDIPEQASYTPKRLNTRDMPVTDFIAPLDLKLQQQSDREQDYDEDASKTDDRHETEDQVAPLKFSFAQDGLQPVSSNEQSTMNSVSEGNTTNSMRSRPKKAKGKPGNQRKSARKSTLGGTGNKSSNINSFIGTDNKVHSDKKADRTFSFVPEIPFDFKLDLGGQVADKDVNDSSQNVEEKGEPSEKVSPLSLDKDLPEVSESGPADATDDTRNQNPTGDVASQANDAPLQNQDMIKKGEEASQYGTSGSVKSNAGPSQFPQTVEERFFAVSSANDLRISVLYSAVRLNEFNVEYTVYVIAVMDGKRPLWHVQKRYSDFLELHSLVKQHHPEHAVEKIGQEPSQKLFSGQTKLSPSKADKRRMALEIYLSGVISETGHRPDDVYEFLSTDVLELTDKSRIHVFSDSLHEGYLAKKGRNFGQWKRRYFVLSTNRFDYYESQEHAATVADSLTFSDMSQILKPLGSVNLNGAKVARQKDQKSADKSSNGQYRHGLLISENSIQDKNEASDRQPRKVILCAESDFERDYWVYFISEQIQFLRSGFATYAMYQANLTQKQQQRSQSNSMSRGAKLANYSYSNSKSTSVVGSGSAADGNSQKLDKSLANEMQEQFEQKSRASRLVDWASSQLKGKEPISSDVKPLNRKSLFGAPLNLPENFAKVNGEDQQLPSVLYRCIDYLEYKKAYIEEGIYRLSGSVSEMNELQSKFDSERDIDLTKMKPQPDVHVVAGLLKLYLRSMPSSLLTPELHRQFMHVTDLTQVSDRSIELARLVSLLPMQNYTILRFLIAHLINIVQHSDVNKMTARNVGIVFAPTMHVPAGVFMLMMADFEFIFWVNSDKDGDNNKAERNLKALSVYNAPEESQSDIIQPKEQLEAVVQENAQDTVQSDSVIEKQLQKKQSNQVKDISAAPEYGTLLPTFDFGSRSNSWRFSSLKTGGSNRNSKLYEESAKKDVIDREKQILQDKRHSQDLRKFANIDHVFNELDINTASSRYSDIPSSAHPDGAESPSADLQVIPHIEKLSNIMWKAGDRHSRVISVYDTYADSDAFGNDEQYESVSPDTADSGALRSDVQDDSDVKVFEDDDM
ncbi:hypothetical protein MIR68_002673 [Amoeboaphelidium protococcarum]|nr:hypothetical protein MIR68_002673 [Amoeboaphelidium protococcarum]